MSKYPEYKNLNLPSIGKEILDWWEKENIFEKSISSREGKEPFVFYEGPPSANGMPGIHHVMARTIKDLFCRYQTLKGKQVKRKAGWDTHGLPIELAVEKTLGITKEDIGKKISIEDYNKECRREVMQYQDKWEELTRMMGYWVDMEHPYITYENNYIESVWWLLKKLYDKKLLYKGYTIQPYSPAAGTGLSTHELNQPGCYRNVKDKTAVAMFKLSEKSKGKIQKLINSDRGVNLGKGLGILDDEEIFFLAWTTTPWTLPANMALAVGKEINYIAVETFHPYPPKTKEFKQDIIVVLAKDLICNILNAQQLEKYIIENLLKGKLLTNKKDIGADGEYIDDNGESILVEVKNKILQREDVFKLIARIKEVDDKEKELHIVCKGYDDDAKIFIEKTIQEHKVPFKLSTVKELIDKTNQPVFKGEDLVDIKYEQLLPYVNRENWNDVAFRVIAGDFVSTEDGTGIVHIAPTFGADDMRAAKEAGISSMLVVYEETKGFGPIVDQRGRYRPQITDFAGEYVKADYLSESEKSTETVRLSNLQGSALNDLISKIVKRTNEYLSVDERIVLKLELDGKLFKKETYEHNYPHCWRTDKPILYYPLDSWFVKVTEKKDEMIRLNKEINWKPEHTGTGRFGEWLNNLQDWNLSRSRFWGIPLPIWRNVFADKKICIGSFADFEKEDFFDDLWNEKIKGKWFYRGKRFDEWMSKIHSQNNDTIQEFKNSIESFIGQKSISDEATRNFINTTLQNISNNSENIFYNSPCNLLEKYLDKLNLADFDFHKPFVDRIIFIEEIENQLPRVYLRESDLIDVWFDSGAMPYAQWHYPFENKEMIDKHKAFPADFIAEGVDQTRGWFYTLHAIAALCFDSVAYKNVVSNGLVLDKNGNKNDKRLGNAVDPFSTLEKYGPDAVRWYMVTNADPWDNLKFDIEGVAEKQRSFFGTFYNTYAFFALYANIDKFVFAEKEIPLKDKSEIDRWILSELNSLIKIVDESYSSYEPTKAGRAIEYFVDEHLSNWYVRLCRRRFWKGEYTQDKISAYQTLYRCLEVVAQLSSPIAPFFCEKLFKNLNDITGRQKTESVHLSLFPKTDESTIDKPLEERMEMAQKISSMVLSIRKKENIRVRQPLTKIRVPILDDSFKKKLEAVKDLILSEVNVKEIEYVSENDTQIVKNIKLNFKTLGKKYGKYMKAVQEYAKEHEQIIINSIERENEFEIPSAFIGNEVTIKLLPEDVEIIPVDIPGWKVANSGALTVALDITITDKLRDEGIAREIVNRIQNLRKDNKFEVTDRIEVKVKNHPKINSAIINNLDYIRAEILANKFEIVNEINGNGVEIEVDDEIKTMVTIDRIKQLN